MADLVQIGSADGVQTLRLNRPEKKNALTSPMYEVLSAALAAGDRSDDVAVHLIVGQPGVFCAGNDIAEFKAYAEGGGLGPSVLKFLRQLVVLEKPLVAAVDGLAIGVGTTMLLHCDLVYASPASTFRTPFLDLGLLPEAGSSLLLPARAGHALAFEMLCLGETFDARKAELAGLINAIVPAGEVEARARAAATKLASRPREALALSRRLMKGADRDAVLARMESEAELFAERLRSAEAREAFTAFMEKRPPDFRKLRG